MGLLSTFGAASGRAFGLTRVGAAIKDAYFNLTTLLLPGNGTNGAQNNTFLDSSTNNFTITRNGNTTQGTFSPFSQTGWSNYFGGSDYLSFASNANLAIGTSDYTLECWVYVTTLANGTVYGAASGGGPVFNLNLSSANVSLNPYGSGNTFSASYTFAVGNWYHIAFARASNSLRVFINGTQIGSTTTDSTNYSQTAMSVASAGGIQNFTGYVSNLRFVKGSALYTANFTPSTTPLTAVTNTQLLTCQSNRFVDNSSNAFALTVNGTPSVQAFSPFAPTAAYSAATNGASGYFDGSGDYLTSTVATLGSSGDLTIEAWVYPTTSGVRRTIFFVGSTGAFDLNIFTEITAGNVLRFLLRNDSVIDILDISSTITVSANTWSHVAFVISSTSATIYLNGTSVATGTISGTRTGTFTTGSIGALLSGGTTHYMNGYVSSFRYVKGTAVYTAAFTPPTAPLTNITNTSLLCNFTNAGIIDATAKNTLETVGNAQISTTQSKWGNSSMYFDGTGDYVFTSSSENNQLGTGDFTIEGWINPSNTTATYRAIVGSENYNATAGGWTIYQNGTALEVWITTTGQLINGTSAISASTWQHFALVRSGTGSNNLKLYVNGTQVGSSATNTASWTGKQVYVGDNNYPGTDYFYIGYIDDLRVTKGYARYTANFSVPTTAFALQ
jgi:hypothetical protein